MHVQPGAAVCKELTELYEAPQTHKAELSNQELRLNAAIGKIQSREKLKALRKKIRDHVNKYEKPDTYHSVMAHLQCADPEITNAYLELDAANQQ